MTLHRNFVNGDWVETAEAAPNHNPSDTGDVIGDYAVASGEDVEAAVSAARSAQPGWAATSPAARAEILDQVGAELLARREEIGDLLAREEGKTLREATAEADRAGRLFKFFSIEAYRSTAEGYQSLRPGVDLQVRREALGVVAAITPWNFPIAIPAWKIAPALAYGNTVVFKPAELTPGCAWVLAEILSRAGLPAGAFNLLMGRGAQIGADLVDHPAVDGVTFTGSTAVGARIGASTMARNARVQLEMGGKNPLIVLEDADLDVAVSAAVQGSFHSAGQRCTASSRLIVVDAIHDAFVSRVRKRIDALVVGDARDPAVEIGPVVSEAQLAVDLDYLRIGEEEGAERVGGARLELKTPGHYLTPALLLGAERAMRVSREEIFGPIATVARVADYEEALATANDAEYGLSSGIVTRDRARIDHFIAHAQAGMVQVNLPTAGMDFHAPFTGRKRSSYGPPEKGSYCREFFTATKVVHASY